MPQVAEQMKMFQAEQDLSTEPVATREDTELLTCVAPRILASASRTNPKARPVSTNLGAEMCPESACWELSVQIMLTRLSLSSNTI